MMIGQAEATVLGLESDDGEVLGATDLVQSQTSRGNLINDLIDQSINGGQNTGKDRKLVYRTEYSVQTIGDQSTLKIETTTLTSGLENQGIDVVV
jgi:hypothetical protein